MTDAPVTFDACSMADLRIDDEASFKHVGLYGDLYAALVGAKYTFRVLPDEFRDRWDHALLLNLTFWGAADGGDVLTERRLDADVVMHVAWHVLAHGALVPEGMRPSADALFLGEAIASAFDVYLVGRLLGHSPRSTFLASQVPAMSDAADAAGMSADAFDALVSQIAKDPDAAFESLRALLFDTSRALLRSGDAAEALAVLARADAHPYGALLHRYELSNWLLYARAYAGHALLADPSVVSVDQALRAAPVALDWLEREWVRPALARYKVLDEV